MSEEKEICEYCGSELEDFVSATEEGTEYFTFCPKCDDTSSRSNIKDMKK